MTQTSAPLIYEEQIKKYSQQLAQLKKVQSLYGWLRLAAILLTSVFAFYVFSSSTAAGIVVILIGIAAFLFLVSRDADNNKKIDNLKSLITINEDELNILSGNYAHRYDGEVWQPELHDYAHDLDVLGKHSIYQWLNRCNSEQGQKLLGDNLLKPLAIEEVLLRQAAIKELAPEYGWRQQLQAYSVQTTISKNTQQKTENWLQEEVRHFKSNTWKIIVPIYSFITILTLAATILGYIHTAIFGGLFFLYFIISGSFSKQSMKSYMQLGGIVEEMDTLSNVLSWIESKPFSAPLLESLKEYGRTNGTTASKQIRLLKEILNRFDLRLNILVFIFLNSFLLWDVRQMRALNKWREENREKVSNWYTLIAEFEVLNSLATLHFNEPSWVLPSFDPNHFMINGSEIGHPLLSVEQRVTSSFHLAGEGKIALVTGSNMAGKSTFLRSLGVNILLAQAGAPVCARSFTLSPVKLMSSMRIADNLAENTSTFYAELKKLKTIIEAVKKHQPVFILLDEILRGTNSLDRHTGSAALMKQLIKEKAVAVIATHDVALAKLEEEYPAAIENYHFDVQVEGEELYFDYKLKEGVCTSLNASLLMKKIGIEMQ